MPWQRIGSTWSADLRSALQVTLHEGFRAKWFRSRSSTATLTSPAIDAIVDVLAKRFEVLVWSNLGMTLKLRKELLSLNHGISNLMDVTRGAQGRFVGATLEAADSSLPEKIINICQIGRSLWNWASSFPYSATAMSPESTKLAMTTPRAWAKIQGNWL